METNIIYKESCLETCKRLPDESIDCVITSPPYWNQRDYGYIEQWGLEPTPEEYLEHLWSLMDELYRILKPEGTVWINLGDTYNGTKLGNTSNKGYKENTVIDTFKKEKVNNIKNKSLLLIPHRFAIGCMKRGWIIRNDIVWAKVNAMPESVTDRFSKKHEYMFLMTKSEKYYFNLDAIKDKCSGNRWGGDKYSTANSKYKDVDTNGLNRDRSMNIYGTKNPGDVSDFWDIPTKPNHDSHYATYNDALIYKPIMAGCPEGGIIYDPFAGTCTTAEETLKSKRLFIASEMSEEFIEIGRERLEPLLNVKPFF